MTKRKMRTLPLAEARLGLARLWFSGSGLFALILIAQSIAGKYEKEVQEVWGWALPTILPTLSLILAVLGASALKTEQEQIKVQRTFYSIALWLSAGYLGLILVTLLIEPLTVLSALSLYKLSNLWLGPFQGLVTSSIGVLFFTREKAQGKDAAADHPGADRSAVAGE